MMKPWEHMTRQEIIAIKKKNASSVCLLASYMGVHLTREQRSSFVITLALLELVEDAARINAINLSARHPKGGEERKKNEKIRAY